MGYMDEMEQELAAEAERQDRHKFYVALVVIILVVSVFGVWWVSTEKERKLHERVLAACGSYGYVAETHLSRYILFNGTPVGCFGFGAKAYGLLYSNGTIVWTDWRDILPEGAK